MASSRQQRLNQLRQELYDAQQRVMHLQHTIAHHAALVGEGIEPHSSMGQPVRGQGAEDDMFQYIGLVENEDDMSNFIGSDDQPETKPRLGAEAPSQIKPKSSVSVSPQVLQLVHGHPNDTVDFAVPGPAPLFAQAEESNGAGLTPGHSAEQMDDAAGALHPVHTVCEPVPGVCPAEFWEWDITANAVHTSAAWPPPPYMEEEHSATALEQLLRSVHAIDPVPLERRIDALLSGAFDRLSLPVRVAVAPQTGVTCLHMLCHRDAGRMPVRLSALLLAGAQPSAYGSIAGEAECALMGGRFGSGDIVAHFDTKERLLYSSPSLAAYALPPARGFVGEAFPPMGSGTQAIEAAVRKVFLEKVPHCEQVTLHSSLLGTFEAECRFWPEKGPDGTVLFVLAQIRDTQRARRMAESYYALFHGIEEGFVVCELDPPRPAGAQVQAHELRVFSMNPAFSRLFSLEGTGAGHSLAALLGPDAEPLMATCLRPMLAGGKAVTATFTSHTRGLSFEVTGYPTEQGRFACMVKDVTEKVRIMQAMRLNESRFAALYRLSHMDAAPEEEVVQFSLDHAVELTSSNIGFLYVPAEPGESAQRYFWSREVQDMFDGFPPATVPDALLLRPAGEMATSLRRGEIFNEPFAEHPVCIGEQLDISRFMVAPIIEDERVVCIVGVANKAAAYEAADLRQFELFINGMWFQLRRRWAVQTLQRAKDEAEAASRAKNEFLANVSHELRTPLNGILGMLQLLQQSTLSTTQLEYVVTANYSGRSLLRIISDILDFSRIEAGRFFLEPHLFDFATTVRSTLGMFVHEAEQKRIKFVLRMGSNIPKVLLGDDARLRQIIFNLVGNAFKFTESGDVAVECSLLPYCPEGKVCMYVAVKDTGIGIPDERLNDIFTAFTQLDGSSTRKYAGTGLGLGIVQRLMQLMGGTLAVESEVGVGTTIHCSIPFGRAEEEPEEEKVVEEHPVKARPLDILVAEDDPVNRLTIRSLLQKQGHRVVCMNNGQQALEALQLRYFDCLITDIQMPVMDGTEVAIRIREGSASDIAPTAVVEEMLQMGEGPHTLLPVSTTIPLVALTAHAMTGDKEYYLSLGMDYYLSKPIIATELEATLNRIAAGLATKAHP